MRKLLFALLVLVYSAPAFASDGMLMLMAAAKKMSASAPSSPTMSALSNSPAQLTATWGTVAEATSYNLYYGTSSPPTTEITGVTSPYTINGPLTASTTYYEAVTAVNGIGESGKGNILSAAAGAVVVDTTDFENSLYGST
jgi:hypothetical protein